MSQSHSSIPSNIVYRLALSKTLFNAGNEKCQTSVDQNLFSTGIIAYHDALDNFIGAICTQLNLSPKKESTLLPTLELIQNHEKKYNNHFLLTSYNEIVQLNTIRNNIKHQGIPPSIQHAKSLIEPIKKFFEEYSKKYFSTVWGSISLADQIKNNEIRQSLKNVESLISINNFKEALEELAIIKFKFFDEWTLKYIINPRYTASPPTPEEEKMRNSHNIFLDDIQPGRLFDIQTRTDFLEMGINREALKGFERLTATVGINNGKDWKYILKHSGDWCELNWTEDIAIYCLDFLIEILIKAQGNEPSIKPIRTTEKFRVRILGDLKLHDKKGNYIATIKEKDERDAIIFGLRDGKWETFNESDRGIIFLEEERERDIFGYFNEGEESKIMLINRKVYTLDENLNPTLYKEV